MDSFFARKPLFLLTFYTLAPKVAQGTTNASPKVPKGINKMQKLVQGAQNGPKMEPKVLQKLFPSDPKAPKVTHRSPKAPKAAPNHNMNTQDRLQTLILCRPSCVILQPTEKTRRVRQHSTCVCKHVLGRSTRVCKHVFGEVPRASFQSKHKKQAS